MYDPSLAEVGVPETQCKSSIRLFSQDAVSLAAPRRKFFLSNCLDTLWTLFCHMDVFFILGQLIHIDIALRN